MGFVKKNADYEFDLKRITFHRATTRYLRTHAFIRWASFCNHTMFSVFDQVVKKHPRYFSNSWIKVKLKLCQTWRLNLNEGYFRKVCWYFEDQVVTFRQAQEMSLRVANYFKDLGFKKGDNVALIMGIYKCVNFCHICLWN